MELPTSKEYAFNDELRFAAIDRLRHELMLPKKEPVSIGTSPLTIGIEIEMTWRHAFPEVATEWPAPNELKSDSKEYAEFSAAYDKNDTLLMPILEKIQPVIPRVGKDAYWEFSFLPTRNLTITSEEIALLYEATILRDNFDYSLHMTVAGIDNERDAFAFLCGLEQVKGTTPKRIREGINTKKGAWSRKGLGGIMKRRPNELLGDDETGYEFRTLTCQSQEQITSVLRRAGELAQLFSDEDTTTWKTYRSIIETTLSEQGLELKAWDRPKRNPTPWLTYIKLLESIE